MKIADVSRPFSLYFRNFFRDPNQIPITYQMKYFGMLWGISFVGIAVLLAWSLNDPNFQIGFDLFDSKIQIAKKSGTIGTDEQMPDQPLQEAPSDFDPNASNIVMNDPEFEKEPVVRIDKSPTELRKEVDGLCKQMQKKLNLQKIENFAQVNFKFHEEKHNSMLFSEMIRGCFKTTSDSKTNLEVDIFSSNFAGRASDQIQIQVSAFDHKSKNKIFETGTHFELSNPAPEIERKASE